MKKSLENLAVSEGFKPKAQVIWKKIPSDFHQRVKNYTPVAEAG